MKTTLYNILSNKIANISISKGIMIPMIQRDYVQGRSNSDSDEIRKQFLENIKETIENTSTGNNNLQLDFIYGYVENESFIPLDGQQRLTTLYLLYWYFALKNNKIDAYQNQFNRFKYQTRQSTGDFLTKLINDFTFIDYTSNSKIVTSKIVNKKWFFSNWYLDNSITSMISMIDDIESIFKDMDVDFDELIQSQTLITFNFLNIEKLGLTDDLYIKMNARGKPLTRFENLKAELGKFIKSHTYNNNYNYKLVHSEGEKPVDVETYFITKIDTIWTDYFWDKRNLETNLFDDKLLNIVSFISINNLAADGSKNFDKIRDDFQREVFQPSFYQLKKLGLLTEQTIIDFIDFLDILVSEDNVLKSYLLKSYFFDKDKLIKTSVFEKNFRQVYIERLRFYGLIKFIKLVVNNDNYHDELFKFERLLNNLTIAPFYFNDSDDFIKSLNGLNILFENYSDDIHKAFVASEITGFDSNQIAEEKIKILLIDKDESWRDLVYKIEGHGYLNNQINFLLTFSEIQNYFNVNKNLDWNDSENAIYIDSLTKYFFKFLMYFNDNGLVEFKNQLFRVALLSIGDFLAHASNYCFLLSNNDRDVSWKRYFREVFSNRVDWQNKAGYLKALFDSTNTEISATENLKNIAQAFPVLKNNWRFNFIKNPDLIGYRNNYFIRSWDEDNDVHLLSQTKFSNRALELQTLLLQRELEKNNISSEIKFVEQHGRSGIVSVGKKKTKVFFNIGYKRYFMVIIHGKEKFYSKSRSEVLKYLLENL
jgi:hypothetical protein